MQRKCVTTENIRKKKKISEPLQENRFFMTTENTENASNWNFIDW